MSGASWSRHASIRPTPGRRCGPGTPRRCFTLRRWSRATWRCGPAASPRACDSAAISSSSCAPTTADGSSISGGAGYFRRRRPDSLWTLCRDRQGFAGATRAGGRDRSPVDRQWRAGPAGQGAEPRALAPRPLGEARSPGRAGPAASLAAEPCQHKTKPARPEGRAGCWVAPRSGV